MPADVDAAILGSVAVAVVVLIAEASTVIAPLSAGVLVSNSEVAGMSQQLASSSARRGHASRLCNGLPPPFESLTMAQYRSLEGPSEGLVSK